MFELTNDWAGLRQVCILRLEHVFENIQFHVRRLGLDIINFNYRRIYDTQGSLSFARQSKIESHQAQSPSQTKTLIGFSWFLKLSLSSSPRWLCSWAVFKACFKQNYNYKLVIILSRISRFIHWEIHTISCLSERRECFVQKVVEYKPSRPPSVIETFPLTYAPALVVK